MKKSVRADLMLVLVTLCWGVSYYMMDLTLQEIDPFTLNAIRFLSAFFVAAALSFRRLRHVTRETFRSSLQVGGMLVLVYIGATFGVKYTTLSNSSFLCALPVIFVPLFELTLLRRRPGKKLTIAVLMSFIGILLLTLQEDFSLNPANLKGDLFCLLCSVAYAVDLMLTERAVKNERVDAYQLGVLQLGVTGVCMLLLCLLFEQPHLPTTGKVWGSVVFLSVFCTGVAFVVQAVAQQYTTAAHVGLIFTLEPVFAAVVAYFFAHEVLTPRAYFGAVLMTAALILAEIELPGKRTSKTE